MAVTLTANEARNIAHLLTWASQYLTHPDVAALGFALPSEAMAPRLREASHRIATSNKGPSFT